MRSDTQELLNLVKARTAKTPEERTTIEALKVDTTADLAKVEAAISTLATLLGDATTVGSIRQIIGTTADPAGTTTLRALKSQTNANVITAASIKALIDLQISLAQRIIDADKATRSIARQTLRLAKIMAEDYTSSDVGVDI